MSDTNCPSPHDSAILVLRERERDLLAEIQTHTRAMELATARREELLDLIAVLGRKPRPRKQRTAEGCHGTPIADTLNDPAARDPLLDVTPRPTVFAVPPAEPGEPADAA